MHRRQPIVFLFLLAFVSLTALYFPVGQVKAHYSARELDSLHRAMQIPIQPGEYFLNPTSCRGCHGYDLMGAANVNEAGEDVNLYDDWETSMMGLSAFDPLWRAKVSHEMLTNPGNAAELQDVCTSCHAPIGHFNAFFKGDPHYTLAQAMNDSLGRAGVGCGGCHQIDPSVGNTFSGQIPYDTTRKEYGPFQNPFMGPMQLYVGILPQYSAHVSEGRMCAPCHTLQTHTVDLAGNPTGQVFTEQATFHEWKNSVYPSQGITCQRCHMPQIVDGVKIANGYTALQPRTPFNLHSFAGANQYMVNLIKQNKAQLNVPASDANFDSTLAAINRQLRYNTLEVSVLADSLASDTAFLSVKIRNKAGHKFPSGYPARRAVVQVVAITEAGDTLFQSGVFDAYGECAQINEPFEPHHQTIRSPQQVQVYEFIMGDVNGTRTTVLERAAVALKDNRIPPLGFNTGHPTYDTTRVVGHAETDADFNRQGTAQGTGIDRVHYHIPLQGYSGNLVVKARVFYQTLSAYWLSEMFTHSSPEISTWQSLWNASDRKPFEVAADSLEQLNIPSSAQIRAKPALLTLEPNPSTGPVNLTLDQGQILSVELWNTEGRRLSRLSGLNTRQLRLNLPPTTGLYYVRVQTTNGELIRRVLRIE